MDIESKLRELYFLKNHSRRDFFDHSFALLAGAGIVPGYIDSLYRKYLKDKEGRTSAPGLVTAAHSFWEPRYAREWGPIRANVAAPGHSYPGQPQLEQLQNPNPNQGLSLYDQIAQVKGLAARALGDAIYITNYDIEVTDKKLAEGRITLKEVESHGFCGEAARFRASWGSPGRGNRVYTVNDKQYLVDEGTMAVWSMVGGTQIAEVNRTDVAWDIQGNKLSDAIYHRLFEWSLNPNRRPVVVNRPKPGQSGEWWVVVNGVTEDLQFFLSDDFNLAPNFFPTTLINSYAEPVALIPGRSVPTEFQAEVDAWIAKNKGGMIGVNLHLIYDVLYNSPRI